MQDQSYVFSHAAANINERDFSLKIKNEQKNLSIYFLLFLVAFVCKKSAFECKKNAIFWYKNLVSGYLGTRSLRPLSIQRNNKKNNRERGQVLGGGGITPRMC